MPECDSPQPPAAVSTDEIAEAARAAIIEATKASREAGHRAGWINGLITGIFGTLVVLGILDALGWLS